MDDIPCLGCGTFFYPRKRLQKYCSNPLCQATRKKIWHTDKIKTDSEYRENQKISQKKWLKSKPSYWKDYRKRNPMKTARNRLLQKVRNQGLHKIADQAEVRIIAKMDAAKFSFRLIPDK